MAQDQPEAKAINTMTGNGFRRCGGFAELGVMDFFLKLSTLFLAFGRPRDTGSPIAILAQIAERMMKPMNRQLLGFPTFLP
jgi:hypothetical protein